MHVYLLTSVSTTINKIIKKQKTPLKTHPLIKRHESNKNKKKTDRKHHHRSQSTPTNRRTQTDVKKCRSIQIFHLVPRERGKLPATDRKSVFPRATYSRTIWWQTALPHTSSSGSLLIDGAKKHILVFPQRWYNYFQTCCHSPRRTGIIDIPFKYIVRYWERDYNVAIRSCGVYRFCGVYAEDGVFFMFRFIFYFIFDCWDVLRYQMMDWYIENDID